MKRKLISILVSTTIIAVLWWQIDLQAIVHVLMNVHAGLLAAALAAFVPIVLGTAWRLYFMVRRRTPDIRFTEALSLTLAAAVMNLVLPSKMGDIAKGVFLKKHGGMGGSAAFSLVILEKANDVLALLLWCGLGLAVYARTGQGWGWLAGALLSVFALASLLVFSRRFAERCFGAARRVLPGRLEQPVEALARAWMEMYQYVDKATRFRVMLASTALWLAHLLQIWLFILALGVENVGFTVSLGLTALAIFIGLLPFTFMGVGTRDAALIYLYSPYFPAATAAALGALTLIRYILPALLGVPVFSRYLAEAQGASAARISC
jgi:glycosyltransferase 2 family protein